jgi:23S rRNA pseudouridine955/2504/2580 synthase
MAQPVLEHRITELDEGQRLDRWLRRLLPQMPLSAIFKHLRAGRVRVDGKKGRQDLRLAAGMNVQLMLPAADLEAVIAAPPRRAPSGRAPSGRAPADARRPVAFAGTEPRIVFRDRDLMVVDKPAGLRAQPGSGGAGRDLVAWLDARGLGARSSTFAPAPAHRLDRGTSGLLAIGLSPAGLRGLTAAFRSGRAQKRYLAVVHGVPAAARGTIDVPLRRRADADSASPKVVVDADGQAARTDYEVLAADGERALLRLVLHTGRTHQIRAHLAHLGHPIVGDRRYGAPARTGDGYLLHAVELELPHPVTGAALRLRAEPPPGFRIGTPGDAGTVD